MTNLLVCAPNFYGVNYKINAWMDVDISVNKEVAHLQWVRMCDRLIRAGAYLRYIEPSPDFPDMVFTANAGLVKDKTVVLSNNRHKERQGESPLFKQWFLEHGYRVIELPKDIYFEGAGDALFFNNTLFMGYGFRTSKESHQIIANALDVHYVSCELVDPNFYHLDTCLFPTKDRVVYYPEAFSQKSREEIMQGLVKECLLSRISADLISVYEPDAKEFVCNSVEIDNTIITPLAQYDDLFRGYDVYPCEMSEFLKAGGAVKCLTLKL
jgi:N-dimethylarginine dimethylaminohydrolase